MIAAAAILDFADAPGQGQPTHVFQPNPTQQTLGWADLPLGGGRIAERVAYLMHLAAFYLRSGGDHLDALSRGLAGLLKYEPDAALESYAWFKDVLDPWAREVSPVYAQTPSGQRASALKSEAVLGRQAADALRRPAVEYFGRLLLWAATALRDGQDGVLQLVEFKTGQDYALLQGEMSKMSADDVNAAAPGTQSYDPSQDNALARLLRTALAAEVNAHERNRDKGIVSGDFNLLEADGRIGLRVTPQIVVNALSDEGLGGVADEYTRTAVEAALAA